MRPLHGLEVAAVHIRDTRDLAHGQVVFGRSFFSDHVSFFVKHQRIQTLDALADLFLIDLILDASKLTE